MTASEPWSVIAGKDVRAFTRSSLDWSDKYQWVIEACRKLRCHSALMDGEIVVQDEDGVSDFAALRTALDNTRPPFAFAGIWRPWIGERKGVAAEHQLYAFLTTESNDLVRPIHAKAMPVMLRDPEAWDVWLTGSIEEALELQSPLPPEGLEIVARNNRADAA